MVSAPASVVLTSTTSPVTRVTVVWPSASAGVRGAVPAPVPAPVTGAVLVLPEPVVPGDGSGAVDACAVVTAAAARTDAVTAAAALVTAGRARRVRDLMVLDTLSGRDTSQEAGPGGFTAWRDSARVGR
jgi:hypothetical protein